MRFEKLTERFLDTDKTMDNVQKHNIFTNFIYVSKCVDADHSGRAVYGMNCLR
jgi:hypothetical protein